QTGFFGYHKSFIDPQFFGSTVISYAVIPFHDYSPTSYDNALSNGTSSGAGLVNAIHCFPLNTGHSTLDFGSVILASTAPTFYDGYNGMTFDSMTQTASHEIGEAMTDPQVLISNPSDPMVAISNIGWNDTFSGNENGDISPPTADALITNPTT